jgi:predicted enzyme related to lactoylglutathione lyase
MTLQATDTEQRMRQGDMSYVALWVPDVDRAARFYADILGWRYAEPIARPYRQVEGLSLSQGITEIAGSGDFLRSMGVPLSGTPSPTAYTVFVVDDIQAGIQRVREAGGWAGEPKPQPYGLVSACMDDQGLVFSLHEVPAGAPAPRSPATGARQGDVAYVVFEVPDASKARAFFSAVFGVRIEPGRSADGWNLPEIAPMSGIAGGSTRPAVVPMYRVDDIQAAVGRVRAAGGTATEPLREGYGIRADCTDDQGVRFYLGQF